MIRPFPMLLAMGLWLLPWAPARAQEPAAAPSAPTSPAASPGSATVNEDDVARALAADRHAPSSPPTTTPPPATAPPAASPPSTTTPSAVTRFFQSFNPDLSAIVDLAAGYYSDGVALRSGDDPGETGFNVQEIEIALQASVDPYFRADLFLAIPNLSGVEVEEAVLTTTQLPGNLQLRAGIIRAGFGRQNTQHLHAQTFTRRPAINPLFLGVDGLRAPGLEINWLVPRLPFFLQLAASAFSVGGAEPDQPLQTFGGGARHDFSYLGSIRAFFPLTETTSLYAGLSYAFGRTSHQRTTTSPLTMETQVLATDYDNRANHLYGADLYLKWKPANTARTQASVSWQTEYFLRHIPDLGVLMGHRRQLEGGLYSQLVVQAARRWYLGARGEVLGIPTGDNVIREYAAGAAITFTPSEFSRIRLYGEARFPRGQEIAGAAFLQLEAAIGAHGAHPY